MKLDLNGQSIDLDFIELYRNEIEEFSGPDEADLCRGACPFCPNHGKAFYARSDTGGFNCFSCGARGSFIDFMMRKHQVGRDEIIQVLNAFSNAEPTDDINNAQVEPEALDDNESSSQQGDGFYMPSGLYLSPAFLSLNKNGIKVLIALLSKSQHGNGHLEMSGLAQMKDIRFYNEPGEPF